MRSVNSLVRSIVDNTIWMWYLILHRMMHRKYIVLGNKFVGLGNRLIAIANCFVWSGADDIVLRWYLDKWVTESFDALFTIRGARNFTVVCKRRKFWSKVVIFPRMPVGNTEFWQFWSPPFYRKELPNGKLFCAYNDTPQWARELYGAFFENLEPSEKVRKRIRECNLGKDIVCVQFRQSIGRGGDTARVANVDRIFSVMDGYCDDQCFFISCMDRGISKMVHERFGDRIIELPNKDYLDMVDAVADMWLLGGGGKDLICQYGSSFSEVAWWWRGCHANVVKVPCDYRQNE